MSITFARFVSAITTLALVASFVPTTVLAQVADTTAPVITINGASTIDVIIDTSTDAGATAVDETDGSVAVVSTGSVDTNTLGSYVITYTATDSATNTASATRTVNVTPIPAKTYFVDAAGSDTNDGLSTGAAFLTIAKAVESAAAGDSISVAAGTYPLASTVTINKADLTITGTGAGSTILTGDINTGVNFFKVLASGFTLKNVEILKTDKDGGATGQGLIYVGANGMTVRDSSVHGQFVIGDGDVTRAFLFTADLSGLLIEGNTIHGLRQPGYLSGPTTGLISDNLVYGTKGWVLEGGDITFTNNRWGNGTQTNVYDIAIIPSAPTTAYTNIVAMSAANNGAVIEDQRVSPAVLSAVYVDASATHSSDLGGKFHPYSSFASAVTRVAAGGTIYIAPGTYAGDVTLNKAVTLSGPNAGKNPNTQTRSEEAVITGQINVYASNVTVDGLTVTNPTWNPASPVTIKGIHVYNDGATVISGITLKNNILSGIANGGAKGSYGVMVQGVVNNVTVLTNKLSAISSQGWSHAIEVTPTGVNPIVPQNVRIEGNVISDVTNASATDQFGFSLDWNGKPATPIVADASQVVLIGNQFLGVLVRNLDSGHVLDVTGSYWGDNDPSDQVSGPGPVDYSPWNADEDGDTTAVAVETTPNGDGTITGEVEDSFVNTTDEDVTVEIEEGTMVTADDSWDGIILPPTASDIDLSFDGFETEIGLAIEVGAGDTALTFDIPARIVFEGEAGKRVGWVRSGVFTEIVDECDDDSSPTLTGIDCKVDNSDDLIVYTKHFTTFATFETTAIVVASGNAGTRGRSGSGSNSTAATASTGSVSGGQVLGASTYNFTVDLMIGSTGADVNELQSVLITAGYLKVAAPTGYFGQMTADALKLWQAAHGVKATGYFGPLTRAAIATSDAPGPVMSAEARAALILDLLTKVKGLQEQLDAIAD